MGGRYNDSVSSTRTPVARIASVRVDLLSRDRVMDRIAESVNRSGEAGRKVLPLSVVSVNLDHLHHFADPAQELPSGSVDGVEWLTLLDGRPVGRAVRRAVGAQAAQLHPGSELLPGVLTLAARSGSRVTLVGGSDDLRREWSEALARNYEGLVDAGSRRVDWAWLDRPGSGAELARWVAGQRADVLVVCLGKPRQELWLRDHGRVTGAGVMLAFGSAAEYIAGTARRPPGWARRYGLEWAVRLIREPRRLWRRYLLDGPRSLLLLRRRLVID